MAEIGKKKRGFRTFLKEVPKKGKNAIQQCGESHKYQLLHQVQFHANVFNHSSKLLLFRY